MDNQIIDILKTVIQQYGDGILMDSKRCRALLQDHCRGFYAREIKLLLLALEEGVANDLRHPPAGLPASLLGSRLVERMVTERFLDRTAAEWTVCAWADAMGILLPTVASVPIKPTKKLISPGVVTPAQEQRNTAITTAKKLMQPVISTPALPPARESVSSQTPTTRKIIPLDGAEMILIPAGEFRYGEKKERKSLPAFTIMKYPVTVAQYSQFCNATGRLMPKEPMWGWQENHPIVNVTWLDAEVFATWAGLVLPTEEEWEKAARGTDGREYPWGNRWDPSKCCNSAGQKTNQTSAVGHYPTGASPYGVQDMAGNVWEWCDSFGFFGMRVLRGGCWGSNPWNCRAAFRVDGFDPTLRIGDTGFRCP